jgi:hypothetical protein
MWFETRKKRRPSSREQHKQSTLGQPPPYAVQQPVYPSPVPYQHPYAAQSLATFPPPLEQSLDLYTACTNRLCNVIAQIDDEEFRGGSGELDVWEEYETSTDRRLVQFEKPAKKKNKQDVFSKLDLYLNSQLPASLPPLQLYIPTYPLLCLAAEYSANAYLSPQSAAEKKHYVSADGRTGSKAMVIKSVPCDDKKTIVFAIRGTSALSLRDWGINLRTVPISPQGFLDDDGNLCHAGFLQVAKAMIRPIAARLRFILQENPGRANCSLLITGHSAGGAVASLLFAHMLSTRITSELTALTSYFKRVHCITFGAPPVSLLPLQKPNPTDAQMRKCLFHSFFNEGDPIVRAEPAYMRSLIDLLAAPSPKAAVTCPIPGITACPKTNAALAALGASMSRLDLSLHSSISPPPKPPRPQAQRAQTSAQKYWWDVPSATLSNAGRLVVLRIDRSLNDRSRSEKEKNERRDSESVGAFVVNDEDLRRVIFGDPLMHQMSLYRERIEALAFRAVTGKLRC